MTDALELILLLPAALGATYGWFSSSIKYKLLKTKDRDTVREIDEWLENEGPDVLSCPPCFSFHAGFWLTLVITFNLWLAILVGLTTTFLSRWAIES